MAPDHRSLNDLCAAFQRLALASCAIFFLSACSDGYPTEDVVGIPASEMSQPQRLEAMNELGHEAHPDLTWHYRSMPDCILQWTIQGADVDKETANLPLAGAGIDLSFDKANQIYSVQVRPAEPSDFNELTILQSTQRFDAIQMSLLLRWYQFSCTASSTSAPRGNSSPS